VPESATSTPQRDIDSGASLEWIDAHHHLWDLSRVHYPWLNARGEVRFFGQPDPIRKNYLPEHYLADTAGRISRSVHVQVGASPGQELQETAFVAECALQTDGRYPAAAVCAVDLRQTDIRADLQAQLEYTVIRGVRHMIGKSPEENLSLPPFEPDVWVESWRVVAQHGLSFDLQLTEEQYEVVLAALRRVPELKVAICHFASPWDRSPEGFRRWRKAMRAFAELPNATMKLSGLSMFTKTWDEPLFLEWASAAVEIFGADRCMLGSNFPVDSLYTSYDQLVVAWGRLVEQCSVSESRALAGGTAAAFYRI